MDEDADLLERLAAHRTIGKVPREELEWLAAHGTVKRYGPGETMVRKGEAVPALFIILKGVVAFLTDQGGGWRKVLEWREGDVSGQLPYSRMVTAPGNAVIEEATEVLEIPVVHLPEIPVSCPSVTAELVHVMVDRARAFKSSDLLMEKLASLGKLAAGLAHELNNPASAAARGAQLVSQTLAEADEASRALAAAGLDAAELAANDRVREQCLSEFALSTLSPLERSDREEELADWLLDHGADDALAVPLVETDVSVDLLNEVAAVLSPEKLGASLRWVAAGRTIRALARDIERAASRVHALVSAVKGFTYMDQATAPEPVDVVKGLNDTVAVLAAKARGKSASVTVEAAPDLPCVRGIGGELNQIWANLVDNAVDAVPHGGHIVVTAQAGVGKVVVRVTDDGPGIPEDLKSRIFDPFFTTKPVGQGTGLGLDIVRRLVERNQGLLEVESIPGRTEFRVALPVA
ncbi:MAG TPA: ATP-binding protein [Rhodothermales bacterium]|nr:ATP-binding protein [Rhodothermales bacterium]